MVIKKNGGQYVWRYEFFFVNTAALLNSFIVSVYLSAVIHNQSIAFSEFLKMNQAQEHGSVYLLFNHT